MTRHIVMTSGGRTSALAGERVCAQFGVANTTFVFSDTLIEDEDLYRFKDEVARYLGVEQINIAEGRTPWQVFFAERFLGNSRIDPCSRILKREMLDRWLVEHCDPSDTVIHYGFDWHEARRLARMRSFGGPWRREAPLLKPPFFTPNAIDAHFRRIGIRLPRLYELGFQHNNCGGACVKAGQASWAILLRELPDRYLFWERMEQEFRATISKNGYILTDRSGDGKKKPLTLQEFRLRIQSGGQYDMFDHGACGCWQVEEPEEDLQGDQ